MVAEGDYTLCAATGLRRLREANAPIRIASFGFLLPHKGFEELLDALALVRQSGADVRLHMLNAEYPAAVSREAIDAIAEKIEQLDLDVAVTLDTIYYTDVSALSDGRADLVVFPYQTTQESSSAAVRHAIASGVPVAVTPLSIFEDVHPAVIELPGNEPEALAKGLLGLIDWADADWESYNSRARAWRVQHSHQVIAQRLEAMLQALAATSQEFRHNMSASGK